MTTDERKRYQPPTMTTRKLRRMAIALPASELYAEPVTLKHYSTCWFLAQRIMIAGDASVAEMRVDGVPLTPAMKTDPLFYGDFFDGLDDAGTTLYELVPPLELKPGETLEVEVWPLHPRKAPPQFARDCAEWLRWQALRFLPYGWVASRWIGNTRFAKRTVAVAFNGIRKEE